MSVVEIDNASGGSFSPFDRLAASEEPLVDVLARLERQGVDGTLAIEPDAIPPGLRCRACGRRHLPRRLAVLEAFRFEGPSAPEDEAIVLVVECPSCGARGALVSAYGPAVTREEAEILADLGSRFERTPGTNG